MNQLVGENHGMRQRLLEKFLFNGRQQVSSIEAAAQGGAAHKAADVAHSPNSAARSVGALALGELCQQIETSGRAGDAANCIALVCGLAIALAQAQTRIHEHLELSPE